MVLVDTSVWIDYLRSGNTELVKILEEVEVVSHPFIIGELVCGGIKNREEFILLLQALSSVTPVADDEYFYFVESNKLYGKGIGFVDIHLLAAAKMSKFLLWTNDKSLRKIAKDMKLSYS